MSTVSIDSRRSTASHRRNEEPINEFPGVNTLVGDVFVFGAGSMGELGLGPTGKDRNVKRPRLNVHLMHDEIGIVDIAVGGMHVAALDKEGRVWTWGVNDQGSLGRDTKVDQNDASMKDDDDDSDSEEELLNPLESKPGLVQGFPEGVKILKLACGDSISVAIASDGKVYSWGTFRVPFLLFPNLINICRRQMVYSDTPNQIKYRLDRRSSQPSHHTRSPKSHVEQIMSLLLVRQDESMLGETVNNSRWDDVL